MELTNRGESVAYGRCVSHVDLHVAYRRARIVHPLEVGADLPLGADSLVHVASLARRCRVAAREHGLLDFRLGPELR